jgi:parvulin-like peptidyl-prolyl isomerase
MRRAILCSLIVLGGLGCNGTTKKHDNPVMVPAPRRVAQVEPDDATRLASASEKTDAAAEEDRPVRTVAGTKSDPWENWEDDTAIYNSRVAATVNGAPILNGEVLDRYSGVLISGRQRMQYLWAHPEQLQKGQSRPTPEDYEKFREVLIQRDLASHIQRKLLVERMKSSLKPDQVKAMNGHIDQLFDKEIDKLKRELKVSTRTELELELNKKGTTLQNVKDNFATERLAMEYIALKSDKPEPIDRLDLIAYYKEHAADYAIPAKVKWEQVQVAFGPERSLADARLRMETALKELKGGAPFAAVAKKYSDGPTAKSGGQWDWMEAGNLADTKLEKQLFEMPIGELSSIHQGTSDLHVVRVLERQNAGKVAFGDVQEEIRKKIEQEQNKTRPKKLFEELFSEAIIETKYDVQAATQDK